MPGQGSETGHAFRDRELETKLLAISRELGLGAQFGGKNFCLETRVVRLPRHGASCPIGLGVSCSADRNIKAKITADGVFLEKLERNPARFLPESTVSDEGAGKGGFKPAHGRNSRPIEPVSDLDSLASDWKDHSGKGHRPRQAQRTARQRRGTSPVPEGPHHLLRGPGKDAQGYASGSFGPTTAGRMDSYVPIFQAQGASMVMLAKGNRSKLVTDSCKKYGGFYLGSIGGPPPAWARSASPTYRCSNTRNWVWKPSS